MSETIIIGEFTISKLRSGESVEFDNGVTVLPASDLATTEALRARVAKLEGSSEAMRAKCETIARNVAYAARHLNDTNVSRAVDKVADAIAALKDAPQ